MHTDSRMLTQITEGAGFIAALDQSGGSTPGALRQYGVPDSAYDGDEAMFRLIHEMRVRIVSAPAFSGRKILGAILFEATMDGRANGKPVPAFLWEERGIVPFLKIDKGLESEAGGVRLMKPIPELERLLERATRHGIFGTKMRSTIETTERAGIDAVVAQQFAVAAQVSAAGLVPIIEPEVSIHTAGKPEAEAALRDALLAALDALPAGRRVMLKLTLPDVAGFYQPLVDHARVARVVALSGGYPLDEACTRLAANRGIIASFSRALINDLRRDMSDAEFDATLGAVIDRVYAASVDKTAA